jgi:hypothetical protein
MLVAFNDVVCTISSTAVGFSLAYQTRNMLRRSSRTVDIVDRRSLNWEWEFTASSSGDSYLEQSERCPSLVETRIVMYRNFTESLV